MKKFTIAKHFLQFEVFIDDIVEVTPVPPFKYEEHLANVFAKTQQLFLERELSKVQENEDRFTVAMQFFDNRGWKIFNTSSGRLISPPPEFQK